MPRMSAVRKKISWLPTSGPDFMQGEDREVGKVVHVPAWKGWSDGRKIKALREIAVSYGHDPYMRWFTVNTVLRPAKAEPRDYERQAAALLGFVQNHIYYTNEPGEQIQSPWWTLRVKTGDCDDEAILLAAMAESIRLPWKFALGGVDKGGNRIRWVEGEPKGKLRAGRWHHIYVMLGWPPFQPQVWKSAEPTMKVPLGHDVVLQGAPGRRGALPELSGPFGAWGRLGSAVAAGVDTATAAGATTPTELPSMSSGYEQTTEQQAQERFVVRQAATTDAQERERQMQRFQFRRGYAGPLSTAGKVGVTTGTATAEAASGQNIVQDEDEYYTAIWKEQGIRGLWRAVPVWGILFAVFQGVLVSVFTTRLLEWREARMATRR